MKKDVLEIGSWGTDCEHCYKCKNWEGEDGCALSMSYDKDHPNVTDLYFDDEGKVYCTSFKQRVVIQDR